MQVLTRPDPAELPRSEEIGRVQGGMAVDMPHVLCIPFSSYRKRSSNFSDYMTQYLHIYLFINNIHPIKLI